MKFIRFYLLTFVIARESRVVAAGDFSQEDLQFIADRLYPVECSQLMSFFPGARRTSKASLTEHRRFRDDWVTENSRAQCLESLVECNEKRKKRGCTKIWLEGALHKLGRADLVSRLKKRWKKNNKNKKKNTRRKSKPPRSGRSNEEKNHRNSRKKIVTSNRRDTNKNQENNKGDDFFGQRFIIFLVAGSLLIIIFLGCLMIVSYRRACRCYQNYLKVNDFKEEKSSLGKSFDRKFSTSETQRLIDSQARNFPQRKEEYAMLIEESDKMMTEDPLWSEDIAGSRNTPKIESFDAADETDDEGYKRSPVEDIYRRNISPCARIKRFFDSPKRLLRGTADTRRKRRNKVPERKKRKKSYRESSVTKKSMNKEDYDTNKSKHDRRKFRKSISSRGKRANRERRAKIIQSNCKTAGQKSEGCTCEMCNLFNVTGKAVSSEKTKMIRRGKS